MPLNDKLTSPCLASVLLHAPPILMGTYCMRGIIEASCQEPQPGSIPTKNTECSACNEALLPILPQEDETFRAGA